MNGHGTFSLHSSLIVLRSWWVDSCKSLNDDSKEGDKFVEISMNDDYFDLMILNNVDIIDFDDLIDAPLTVGMYDQFILYKEFGNSCSKIDGVIVNYKHDKMNEKLSLIVDVSNISPLMYFDKAKFKIKEMYLMKQFEDMDISKDDPENTNTTNILTRSRRRMLGFTKTINLPLPSFSGTYDIKIGNTKIGSCSPSIVPLFNIIAGFSLDFSWDWSLFKPVPVLDLISGRIGVEGGVDTSITCTFDDSLTNQDGYYDINVFSKEIDFVKLRASIGPLVITVTPFIGIGASILRPAFDLTLSASTHVSGSIVAIASWSRSQGFFGDIEREFNEAYLNLDNSIEYTGKDGRVESSFSINVEPGIKFGLWSVDLLYVSAPMEFPKIRGELGVGDDFCDLDGYYDLELNLYGDFTISFSFGILPISIFGFTIFDSVSWTPQDPLFSKTLFVYTNSFGCVSIDDIDSDSLFEGAFEEFYYNDNGYILIELNEFLFLDTLVEHRVNWYEANAYCSMHYGTSLATIDDSSAYSALYSLVDLHRPYELYDGIGYEPHIGCYLDKSENKWKWISDNSYLDSSLSNTLIDEYSIPEYDFEICSVFSVSRSFDSHEGLYPNRCSTKRHAFVCDAPDVIVYDEKYIGVYTYTGNYNEYYDWYDANSYCNDTFGTELATILSSNDNEMVVNILSQIKNGDEYRSENDLLNAAWIGINGVISFDNFTWQDGRDSYTTGYNNWYSGWNINTGSDNCGTINHFNTGGDDDDKWVPLSCDSLSNVFVCNRPDAFNFLEYKDYVGVEAVNYGLTFDEANYMCETTFGTTLASIHSLRDNNNLATIASQMEWDLTGQITSGWIGLSDSNIEGTFLWNDNTVLTYTNWHINTTSAPISTNFDCVLMHADNDNMWFDDDCDARLHFFWCNREKTIYEYNKYIGINTHSDSDSLTYTFDEANNYCLSNYGTTLASIHSSSDQADIVEIFNIITYDQSNSVWIGATNIQGSTNFEWLDGTPVDYTSWYPNEPNSDSVSCGDLRFKWNGLWNDRRCGNTLMAFICNRPNVEIITNNYIGVYSHSETYTFTQANAYCSDTYGTTLASILNEDEWNEALGIFMAFDNSSLWIGLNDESSEGNFKWVDGFSSSYIYNEAWYDNEPNSESNNVEDCVEMRSNFDGYWNDQDCGTSQNGFICNQPILTYSDGHYIGVNFHHTDGDYLAYDDANNYCNTHYGTTLATQMSDNDINGDERNNELVNVFNSLLITNNMAWIGLSDSITEGVYQWIDGSQTTVSQYDSHWRANQPKGDSTSLSKDCVYLNGDDSIDDDINIGFSTTNCLIEYQYAFICNNKYNIVRYNNYIGVTLHNSISDQLDFFDWYTAENYCNTHFGTNLASVHSTDEFDDLNYVYQEKVFVYNTDVWIGLHYNDNNQFEWIDGTTTTGDDDDFDYNSLWDTNEPNNYNSNAFNNVCVYLSQHNGQLIDDDCSGIQLAAFICNAN